MLFKRVFGNVRDLLILKRDAMISPVLLVDLFPVEVKANNIATPIATCYHNGIFHSDQRK